jgi:DNA-binding HxlR family transcriptional regulator
VSLEISLSEGRSARAGRLAIPRPGEVFDPVARALDLIGDRWTLVLVRQLLGGPVGFQELRARTGIAPRVLSTRLRQLIAAGFIEAAEVDGGRSAYAVTERGRSLEPIIAAIARWFVDCAISDLDLDVERFTETSPLSILESLRFLLREDAARGAHVTFEIRLTGEGGGIWTVRIHDGACSVEPGFAREADVRYTADARTWCGVALGLLDARDAMKRGLLHKEGGREAMDHYFHQPARRRSGEIDPDPPSRPEDERRTRP